MCTCSMHSRNSQIAQREIVLIHRMRGTQYMLTPGVELAEVCMELVHNVVYMHIKGAVSWFHASLRMRKL